MAAFKNKENGTWYVQFRYTDWRGERQQKLKRGFPTKKAAVAWEREFLMQKQADLNMTFESFVELYEKDVKPKLKLNTWLTKESIIQKKILPYFRKRKLSEINARDIISWQNEMRNLTDKQGNPYSATYLKTIHNQMSAIFNHAVRYYGLQVNPAQKAGSMGEKEAKEMLFWTKEEFLKFIDAMMDSPIHYYAFEMLYWCGLRVGELFALTPDDFNFETGTVTISKSYQRIGHDDVVTDFLFSFAHIPCSTICRTITKNAMAPAATTNFQISLKIQTIALITLAVISTIRQIVPRNCVSGDNKMYSSGMVIRSAPYHDLRAFLALEPILT